MNNFRENREKSGKTYVGWILLGVGVILLLRTLDLVFVPHWVTSWPMFLIIIGCFVGARQGYDKPSAFMPIVIGLFFLSQKIFDGFQIGKFFWPALIIGFGVWLLTGRRNPFKPERPPFHGAPGPSADPYTSEPLNDPYTGATLEGDDRFESVSIFGGVKKNVVSKNFKGGEIVNFFGGAEINLIQADMNGRVVLEVVQVFGGTKIIVPANWTVHSEMVAIFGGIEDKRPPQLNPSGEKVLIIQGTSIFGGIDIKSF